MAKYKVGDTIKSINAPEYWGDIVITSISDTGSSPVAYYGRSAKQLYDGCWFEDNVMAVVNSELEELRKFKADAIAKYPDLVPPPPRDDYDVKRDEWCKLWIDGQATTPMLLDDYIIPYMKEQRDGKAVSAQHSKELNDDVPF